MNMTVDLVEKLRSSTPEIELAAYNALIAEKFPNIWDRPDDLKYARVRISQGPWCKETTYGARDVISGFVNGEVRREHHVDTYGQHFFLVIPVVGDTALRSCDIIIDPTYKQFARPDMSCSFTIPNVFIGTRFEMWTNMQTPMFADDGTSEFEDWGTSPDIFLADTLRSLDSIGLND